MGKLRQSETNKLYLTPECEVLRLPPSLRPRTELSVFLEMPWPGDASLSGWGLA
jgi:hypothetical protein